MIRMVGPYSLTGTGKVQYVYCTVKDEHYIKFKRKRYYLEDFKADRGLLISKFHGLAVEVLGDKVKVWKVETS